MWSYCGNIDLAGWFDVALAGERPVASLLLRTRVEPSDLNEPGEGYSCLGGAVCLKDSLVGNGDN